MLQRLRVWIVAIRDSFITLLPMTFFGVLATLALNLPVPAYQTLMLDFLGGDWPHHAEMVIGATHGLFGIALSILVALHVWRRIENSDASNEAIILMLVGISTLTNFMLCVIARPTFSIKDLGHDATYLGLLIGVISAELLHALTRWQATRPSYLPYDTEAIFYHSIRLTPPIILAGISVIFGTTFLAALPSLIANPIPALADWAMAHRGIGVWWSSTIAVLINHCVWFMGAHGGYVLDTFAQALFVPHEAGYDDALVLRPLLNNFVLLGGAGTTLGLLMALPLVFKEGVARKVGQMSLLPGLFNINESVLYGLPVVLNRYCLIPFILTPLVLMLLTLAAINTGFLDIQPVAVSWTTPPLISGWLLTGSWRGAAFQVFELVIATLMYLPFLHMLKASRARQQAQSLQTALHKIASETHAPHPASSWPDNNGLIARGLLGDLRAAINDNSLAVAYQPKHDAHDKLIGFEALLRWHHPRHGTLSPLVAITLAEQHGDIHALGNWMIAHAFACKARWSSEGKHGLTMAINVSPIQLSHPELVSFVSGLLQEYQLNPQEIEFEITESQGIPDTDAVVGTLRALSSLGIRLAMDDFGMGHSSLLYLRRFKVAAIKIDGSLTRDILSNVMSADIVRSIVSLGSTRNVMIVAEFVETEAQRNRLAELGCNCFQGYLYSAPSAKPLRGSTSIGTKAAAKHPRG